MLITFLLAAPAVPQAQVLPLEQENAVDGNWFVYEPSTKELVPYTASVHGNYHALHQWVNVNRQQAFLISFTAQKNLCLFLNNRLVFTADSTSKYKLNLTDATQSVEPSNGKYLLTVWHPGHQPNISSFQNVAAVPAAAQQPGQQALTIKVREYVNQNAFIIFMLLIGLIYGWLKVNYPADFGNFFRIGAGRPGSLDKGFLTQSITSWSNVLFILAFSLSMALLIVAIHTNVQHVRLFNRLFPVSEADITTKIVFYTFLVFVFILLKYLFLKVMGFIFELEQVVQLQYREFIRTILFLGMFLPLVMLMYLSLNAAMPETVLLISNLAVSLLLGFTIIRVFITVNKKSTVLNLHLFSYLCATEVIPLAIMLKLIVFNF